MIHQSSPLARPVPRGSALGFELENQGYSIARGLVPPAVIAAIDGQLDGTFARTPFGIGAFYGERTKRFGRLVRRSRLVAERLVLHPVILELAQRILGPWCDNFQLNVAQAIEIHPGALAQFPHRDQDMWRGVTGRSELLINIIWPLCEFRADNGATRVWPQSHGMNALESREPGDPVYALADPGDALIFLGSTLHAAGAHIALSPRRAIVIGYSLGWLKPYENPYLAYPPAIARTFPPELAALVGYRQHRPNLGNFEGVCPSILLHGEGDGDYAATDALLPEQVVALDLHARQQMLRHKPEIESMTP